MAKKIKKTDWWVVGGLAWLVSGLLIMSSAFKMGWLFRGLFGGGLNALLGVGLLQRSKLAFWVTTVGTVGPLLKLIDSLNVNQAMSFGGLVGVGINVVIVISTIMLWLEVDPLKAKKGAKRK